MHIRPLKIRQAQKKYHIGTLLTTTNPKANKSLKKLNIPTAVLHLLPKYRGGCPFAGTCAELCLHGAGNPAYMKGKTSARKNRTDFFCDDRELFMEYLLIETVKFRFKYANYDIVAERLNGTQDNRWERESITVTREVSEYLYSAYGFSIKPGRYRNIFYAIRECSTWYAYPEKSGKKMFEFYDYTKRPDRIWDICKQDGYHLTVSHGSKADVLRIALDNNLNIAAAFNLKRNATLPLTVKYGTVEFPVVDGDVTDFRPQDPSNSTHVVGLRLKRVPGMTPSQIKNFCIA